MWTVLPSEEYLYPNFYNCQNLHNWYKEIRSNFIEITNEVKEGTLKINKKLGFQNKHDMIDAFLLLDLIHTREV